MLTILYYIAWWKATTTNYNTDLGGWLIGLGCTDVFLIYLLTLIF